MKQLTVAVWMVCVVCMAMMMMAATRGDSPSIIDNGAVNVTTAAAIAVPTTCKKSTNSFMIFNHGPNTIWCGGKSTVDNTTGTPVGPETSLTIDVTCDVNVARFWCRADTADQTSPLNTRYLQVK